MLEIVFGNSWQAASSSEVGYSQASRQENTLMVSGNCWHEEQFQNNVMRKRFRTLIAQGIFLRVRLHNTEFQNMGYTSHQYMTNIFQFLQKTLGITALYSTSFDGSIESKCVDMENVHIFVDESSHSSWAELFDEFGNLQEHEFRGE